MALFEYILLGVAVLLLLSVISSKASTQLGVPTLVLFLAIGMLAGSDGPGDEARPAVPSTARARQGFVEDCSTSATVEALSVVSAAAFAALAPPS